MSVFTSIDSAQLEAFIASYPVGTQSGFTGIEAGITNSNFFVDTTTGRYVLTIVEHEHHSDVEWFMQLLAYLHSNNIPCAMPVKATSGVYTGTLADKPATIVECLKGSEKVQVNNDDCHAVGRVMADFHVSCTDYPSNRQDSRGAQWRAETAKKVRPKLTVEETRLLDTEMQSGYAEKLTGLPQSVVHADLFRDNVLFFDSKEHAEPSTGISGIIDFYYACNGCMLYDLAITFNDWCRDDDSQINLSRAQALLAGYESIRPLEAIERDSWHLAVRCAALRFWLSRLHDLHFPPEGLLTFTKDPVAYEKILLDPATEYADIQQLNSHT